MYLSDEIENPDNIAQTNDYPKSVSRSSQIFRFTVICMLLVNLSFEDSPREVFKQILLNYSPQTYAELAVFTERVENHFASLSIINKSEMPEVSSEVIEIKDYKQVDWLHPNSSLAPTIYLVNESLLLSDSNIKPYIVRIPEGDDVGIVTPDFMNNYILNNRSKIIDSSIENYPHSKVKFGIWSREVTQKESKISGFGMSAIDPVDVEKASFIMPMTFYTGNQFDQKDIPGTFYNPKEEMFYASEIRSGEVDANALFLVNNLQDNSLSIVDKSEVLRFLDQEHMIMNPTWYGTLSIAGHLQGDVELKGNLSYLINHGMAKYTENYASLYNEFIIQVPSSDRKLIVKIPSFYMMNEKQLALAIGLALESHSIDYLDQPIRLALPDINYAGSYGFTKSPYIINENFGDIDNKLFKSVTFLLVQ